MTDPSDSDLLRDYAVRGSETAFGELTRRHVNFVYSVAMRYMGNSPDAQDVVQAVFIILARKSARLCGRSTLTGWLYEATRLTAGQFVRTRARRLAREKEAYMQSTLDETGDDPLWHQLAPLLEKAMSQLRSTDRELLALRFYENKTGEEAALLMGIGAAAAHKRTERALDKLREFFARRGVSSTAAIIAGAISANSVQAAPAGLAQAISAAAITKGAAASTSTLTLVKGALKVMAWTNTKTAIAVGAGILLLAGAGTVTMEGVSHYREDAAWARIARAVQTKNFQFVQNLPSRVSIRSSRFYPALDSTFLEGQNGKTLGAAIPAAGVFGHAFNIIRDRIINQDLLPAGRYDFVDITTNHPSRALQAAAEKMFGVTATRETIETNVFVLTVADPSAPNLKQTAHWGNWHDPIWMRGYAKYIDTPISFFAYTIERRLNVPVVDETGLTNRYDMTIRWSQDITDPDPQMLQQALLKQLGLKLTPDVRPVEILVLEKAS